MQHSFKPYVTPDPETGFWTASDGETPLTHSLTHALRNAARGGPGAMKAALDPLVDGIAAQKPVTTFLSAESFIRVDATSLAAAFADRLPDQRVIVLLYIRPYHDLALSRFMQSQKMGLTTRDFQQWLDGNDFYLRPVVETWSAAFSGGLEVFYLPDANGKSGPGALIVERMAAQGIAVPPPIPPGTVNLTPSARETALRNYAHREFQFLPKLKAIRATMRVVRRISRSLDLTGDKVAFPAVLSDQLALQMREDAEWMDEKVLGAPRLQTALENVRVQGGHIDLTLQGNFDPAERVKITDEVANAIEFEQGRLDA